MLIVRYTRRFYVHKMIVPGDWCPSFFRFPVFSVVPKKIKQFSTISKQTLLKTSTRCFSSVVVAT